MIFLLPPGIPILSNYKVPYVTTAIVTYSPSSLLVATVSLSSSGSSRVLLPLWGGVRQGSSLVGTLLPTQT